LEFAQARCKESQEQIHLVRLKFLYLAYNSCKTSLIA
jgi:hypothetical protein